MNASEWTCLWYLRLNGYLTMPNFIAHGRPTAKTDVDVLAVRFKHSREAGFQDDKDRLQISNTPVDVVLAEAKQGCIRTLNGPWAKREGRVLDYVLARVGVVPAHDVEGVAEELYNERKAARNGFTVRICAFAESASKDLLSQGVTFVNWKSVFEFIHERFHDNNEFKRDHDVWDDFGKYLWQHAESCSPTDYEGFFQGWDEK